MVQIFLITIPGEIFVAGNSISKRYTSIDETHLRYIKLPYMDEYYFRTGDEEKLLDDGTICIYGLLDNQIKINGNRVELR